MTTSRPQGVPTTWQDWAGDLTDAPVTEIGRPVVRWAVEMMVDFYGNDWFAAMIDNRTVPVMNMYEWPLRHPMAVVFLLERAARLSLLDGPALDLLRTEVRRSRDHRYFDHLDIVLEVAGLAARAGWQVRVDVPNRSGRRPDLRLARPDFTYTVEVTTQGMSKTMRESDEADHSLSWALMGIEARFTVEIAWEVRQLLTADQIESGVAGAEAAASRVGTTGVVEVIDIDGGEITVYPPGERPSGTTGRGPALSEPAWPRIENRLQEKARQTEGSGSTWIRLQEGGGLFMFTSWAHLGPEDQLAAVHTQVEQSLAEFPHVRGVILDTGVGPNWTPNTPNMTVTETGVDPRQSAAVIDRVLPGYRRRRTYILPLRAGRRLLLPPHMELAPAHWYADETGWLDWALHQLGQPILGQVLAPVSP